MGNIVNIKGNGYTPQNESLRRHIAECMKYPILTPEQEVNLMFRYKSGDVRLKNVIINSNQRFVLSVAKTFSSDPDTIMDLISEGNIGISEAIDKFDPTRGFKFITYAVWYIRKSMSSYMNKNSLVVDKKTNTVRCAIRRIKEEYFKENEREIPDDILAERVREVTGRDFKTDDAVYSVKVKSIENYRTEDGPSDTSPFDFFISSNNSAEDTFRQEDAMVIVRDIMKRTLNKKEYDIIDSSYGLTTRIPMSDNDIGFRYNMSGERIRQIRRRAIEKLKLKAKTVKY